MVVGLYLRVLGGWLPAHDAIDPHYSHPTQQRCSALQVGALVVAKGWYNGGYIFPQGFKSRVLYRQGARRGAPACLKGVAGPVPLLLFFQRVAATTAHGRG
jgi:hypothetical protein